MNQNQEIQDIGESVVFQHSQFLQMIYDLNTKGEIIKLNIKADEFNNVYAFIVQMTETLKGLESDIFNNLEDIKATEQFKDLFKDMKEEQILSLLQLAEYLDIPNLIMLLAAQYSSLIKGIQYINLRPTIILNKLKNMTGKYRDNQFLMQ